MKIQTEVVLVREYTIHILLPGKRHSVKWYVVKGCTLLDEILEEGESDSRCWAEREARRALFNQAGIRD